MNVRFRPQAPAGLPDAATDGGLVRQGSSLADRACCCVARAVVRVTMPPAEGRPHETELLLCGHHYRVSRAALSAAHAQVEELRASWVASGAWFDDDRRPAHAAAVAR
jgi:hypothetical protein